MRNFSSNGRKCGFFYSAENQTKSNSIRRLYFSESVAFGWPKDERMQIWKREFDS